jgi:H+/Cl- antiporter ClcA
LQGTKINIRKSTLFLIYYTTVVSYLIYNSFSIGVSVTYLIPYVLIAIFSGFFSYWYSKASLLFWREKIDNNLYVKGGILIYLVYILTLIVRIIINLIFIGYQEISFTEEGNIITINHPLVYIDAYTRITTLIVTDSLIMLGTGMLIGRYTRVIEYRHRSSYNHNEESMTR